MPKWSVARQSEHKVNLDRLQIDRFSSLHMQLISKRMFCSLLNSCCCKSQTKSILTSWWQQFHKIVLRTSDPAIPRPWNAPDLAYFTEHKITLSNFGPTLREYNILILWVLLPDISFLIVKLISWVKPLNDIEFFVTNVSKLVEIIEEFLDKKQVKRLRADTNLEGISRWRNRLCWYQHRTFILEAFRRSGWPFPSDELQCLTNELDKVSGNVYYSGCRMIIFIWLMRLVTALPADHPPFKSHDHHFSCQALL